MGGSDCGCVSVGEGEYLFVQFNLPAQNRQHEFSVAKL